MKKKESKGSLFVTGATGFVGSSLCKQLLRRGKSLALLSRPESVMRLRRWIHLLPPSFPEPRVVLGDLRQDELGLSKGDMEFVFRDVTEVFHVAASYHLSMGEQEAQQTNVEGTGRVLQLASGIKSLNRFHHVSSIVVSGDHQGEFLESDLDKGQDFPHSYSRSKFLSEQLVRKSALPYTIYRPGVVVGDSTTGEMDKVDGLYYVFKILHTLLKIPGFRKMPMLVPRSNKETFPVVPIDYLVKSMAYLAGLDASLSKTYHLVDPSPLSFRELYLSTLDEMGFVGPRIGRPVQRLVRLLTKPWLWPISKKVGAAIDAPAEMMPHILYSVAYDTTNTQADLSGSGISCPPLKEYLRTLIEYYFSHLA